MQWDPILPQGNWEIQTARVPVPSAVAECPSRWKKLHGHRWPAPLPTPIPSFFPTYDGESSRPTAAVGVWGLPSTALNAASLSAEDDSHKML